MSEEEFDFEEQIRLEEEERKKAAQAKTKVDEDGTEYEWDEAKKAWFPKIDANFIAQYQMSYGNFEGSKDSNESAENKAAEATVQNIPPAPPVDHPAYYYWYYHIYLPSTGQGKAGETDTNADTANSDDKCESKDSEKAESANEAETTNKAEAESGKKAEAESGKKAEAESGKKAEAESGNKAEADSTKTDEKPECKDSETTEGGKDSGKTDTDGTKAEESESYDEYYKHYYDYYYGQQTGDDGSGNSSDWSSYYEYYKQYYDQSHQETGDSNQEVSESGATEGEDADKSKKAKKRKQEQQEKDQGWFEMDQSRNTSVYVSNLPHDITDEEFKELMAKYGLIAMEPKSNKLKLKLYRNKDGEVKGDGLCSYIKMESVDLALDILDGYRLRNYEISVEPAKFELKGSYDPTKKKKKLTNKEKRKLKEKQEKLFDWKLDKAKGIRNNWEKTLVFKNVFDPTEFEANPASIFKLRDKLKQECLKYGTVRKVVVYDRHPEKVATVAFAEVEEADVCRQQMDNRFFNQRTIQVDAWDGKMKYTVKETEEEEKKRLGEWAKYLQEEEAAKEKLAKESKAAGEGQATVTTSKQPKPSTETALASSASSQQPLENAQLLEPATSTTSVTSTTSATNETPPSGNQPEMEAMDTSEVQTPDSSAEKG